MVAKLIILEDEHNENINLQTNQSDVWAIAIKFISNLIPGGSAFGELITNFIPNQKIDRLKKFTEKVNEKLIDVNSKSNDMEKRIIILEKLKTPESADLFEECANQAVRALSDKRIEYIASLLKNSLTDEELEHLEKKKLLSILNQLNDAEIIWLKKYSMKKWDKSFFEKHEHIFEPPDTRVGRGSYSQTPFDKKALQESYVANLLSLRLIYNDSPKDFNSVSTNLITEGNYHSSDLGNLLLRYIDLQANDD